MQNLFNLIEKTGLKFFVCTCLHLTVLWWFFMALDPSSRVEAWHKWLRLLTKNLRMWMAVNSVNVWLVHSLWLSTHSCLALLPGTVSPVPTDVCLPMPSSLSFAHHFKTVLFHSAEYWMTCNCSASGFFKALCYLLMFLLNIILGRVLWMSSLFDVMLERGLVQG